MFAYKSKICTGMFECMQSTDLTLSLLHFFQKCKGVTNLKNLKHPIHPIHFFKNVSLVMICHKEIRRFDGYIFYKSKIYIECLLTSLDIPVLSDKSSNITLHPIQIIDLYRDVQVQIFIHHLD